MRTEEGPARVPGTESSGARMEVRRRLLQGLFAVPAVVPLTSGAQTAAGSSPVRCFTSQTATSEVVNLNTMAANWGQGGYAWAVRVYTTDAVSGSKSVFKGSDVQAWVGLPDVGGAIDGTKYPAGLYLVSDGSTFAADENTGTPTATAGAVSLNLEYVGGTPPFKIVSVGASMPQPANSHPMWGSCWSSCKP